MLNKVETLISIGKFRNYTASGQVNFHRLTTIYGDNGGGKTTLAAVFRSLTNNSPEIIRSRISTNHTQPQAAQITFSNPTGLTYHTFGSSGWTAPIADIEIFDIHFVNENVYSGFEFNDDHKKQLHKFVVGAQGVAIQQQIEQNKTDKAALTQAIGNAEQQLIRQVGDNLTTGNLSTFLAFRASQAANIDTLISTAEAALVTANSNSTIQTLSRLTQISVILSRFDFDAISQTLVASTESVQDAALKSVLEAHCNHLSEHNLEAPENWLRAGFEVTQAQSQAGEPLTCPFCTQSLNTSQDIFRAYTNFFDDAFNQLIEQIESDVSSIAEINITNICQTINTTCSTNDNSVASWRVHLPPTVVAPANDIIADETVLRALYASCMAAVQQKFQNPTAIVDSAPINELKTAVFAIDERIEAYNLKVRTYNAAITNFLATIQTVQQAQTEVNRLKQIKKRFDPAINAICVQMATDKTRLTTLQRAYTHLSQQQEAAATAFFTRYKDRINHYLGAVFHTHFQIDNVAHIPPQGRATQGKMGYKLVIDGKDISFEPNRPFSAKECLSEGDKSTIALAFFLSKLDIDPNRSDKILIFDDPLSSLDTNRRMYTINIIRGLMRDIKQVVVLSHNEHFLYEIFRDFSPSEKKALRITENFAAKASIIELCNLDELVKSEYFKQLDAIIQFRTAPDHTRKDQILGYLRNVLEGHLNFKFYQVLSGMPGQKTFGSQIRYLAQQGTPFRDNANRTSIIADLNMINSIAWKPHHSDPMPDYGALGINPNSITPAELDNLIQDTLNLIDNQL